MNRDSIRGKWEELKGKFKREYGHSTGDRKTEVKGAVQEGAGKVQRGLGELGEDLTRRDPEPR